MRLGMERGDQLMNKYKIESNIEIPANIGRVYGPLLANMSVGDSVFFEINDIKGRSGLQRALKNTKLYQPVTRQVKNGWRVWKVLKEDES